MSIKPVIITVIALGIIGIITYVALNQYKARQDSPLAQIQTQITTKEDVHFHAGFQVYRDNELIDFSGMEHMTIVPCSTEDAEEHSEDDFIHLHGEVGDVVHIHGPGVIWADVFEHLDIPVQTHLIGYIDGEQISDVLLKPVEPYQSSVFFIDSTDDIQEKVDNRISRERIEEVEEQSEACGT